MSKSTRFTQDALDAMGLEPDGKGGYIKKNKERVEIASSTIDGLPNPSAQDVMKLYEEHGVFYYNNTDLISADIHLVVSGEPTPQQRHRHHQVKGSNFVNTYDPSSKKKKEFLKACLPYKPDKPYEQPLRVDMVFYFSRPKSHYRTGKYAHLLKDSAPEYHTSRGDLDNLCKMPMDSLNKIFWKDDAYIAELSAVKKYDEHPRTEITITIL